MHRTEEESAARLDAALAAWNAEQLALVAADEARKAARRADPKAQAQSERARAYRERNRDKINAQAKARRAKDRAEYLAARAALREVVRFPPPVSVEDLLS